MEPKKIYLDNASTSFPKPPQVPEAMISYMNSFGCNINRGGYEKAYETESAVFRTREKLCRLFDFDNSKNVIFSANITYALNMILKGYLKPGDHCLVSAMEHNALMRPLTQLEKIGISYDLIPCEQDGSLNLSKLEPLIKKNTRAVIMTGASNVCGTMMPLTEVGKICQERGLAFIVDSAQIAGVHPISMKKMGIDVLCFTGHKGLLGPQGIGGFLITDEMAAQTDALISGGTGSFSDSLKTPDILPDKYEAGTMNLPGIIGLGAGLDFLEETGLAAINSHEMELTELFLAGIHKIAGYRILGIDGIKNRTAVVSLQSDFMDEATLAFLLDSKYGIMTRVGLHCAPNAHKTLGSYPRGSIRFSFGYFTTKDEIKTALQNLEEIRFSGEINE
ncbi:MAG: aminotransferase class V-fold PLP-dependent enzyme [Lachnospiraceae bacterium]